MEKKKGIERYKEAQDKYYETALREIECGKKKSDWMLFIFPQILKPDGLKDSYYLIANCNEAKAYWADPLLSSRLIESTRIVLESGRDPQDIFGYAENTMFRSCMTLFWEISKEPIFKEAINVFYRGGTDGFTLAKLK